MSDRMRPIPFAELLEQTITEYRGKGTMFYVPVEKIDQRLQKIVLNGKIIESPIGPAAGPHTQLAHNIIAAYAAGARYFELKTVQVLDGKDLGIQKPCIYVNDEAYNTEWSTELTVYEALEEYIKAWILLKVLSKEFQLGDPDGFLFNISVGYNLEGVKSEKIDYFIETLKDGSKSQLFSQYKEVILNNLWKFSEITKEYVDNISPEICNTVTLSTMHGCPVEEIENITSYLIDEKRLNTYLKCNPTLLGYEKVRTILDQMGYSYITFHKESFQHDLEVETAVSLIKRLQRRAKKVNLEFGIKLTNTFPVKIIGGELAGTDMYMSGAPLYPLAIGVAALLAEALGEDLIISYSGGADVTNISKIYGTGICPITVSTFLLKPIGYRNLTKLNQTLCNQEAVYKGKLQIDELKKLAIDAYQDKNYYKPELKDKRILKNLDYTLYCSKCKNCVDVCPNRANYLIQKESIKYTIHKDSLCNECGNCSHFCIMAHHPYKDKFTIFDSLEDFYDSTNTGVYMIDQEIKLRYGGKVYDEINIERLELPEDIKDMILTLVNYSNLEN